jgi:hypothetical protein
LPLKQHQWISSNLLFAKYKTTEKYLSLSTPGSLVKVFESYVYIGIAKCQPRRGDLFIASTIGPLPVASAERPIFASQQEVAPLELSLHVHSIF